MVKVFIHNRYSISSHKILHAIGIWCFREHNHASTKSRTFTNAVRYIHISLERVNDVPIKKCSRNDKKTNYDTQIKLIKNEESGRFIDVMGWT